jgi:hypothetical protein
MFEFEECVPALRGEPLAECASYRNEREVVRDSAG